MRPVPMRFMGYTWHHNPKELSVECGKTIVKFGVPYFREMLQSFGDKLITVKGTGELYGDDCIQQYSRLKAIYEKGGTGILCLPHLLPIYACFESLNIVADEKPGVLTYEFVFTQVKSRASSTALKKTVNVKKGQTLWDISYEYNVDIETLVLLNPHIMFINEPKGGEVVNLC